MISPCTRVAYTVPDSEPLRGTVCRVLSAIGKSGRSVSSQPGGGELFTSRSRRLVSWPFRRAGGDLVLVEPQNQRPAEPVGSVASPQVGEYASHLAACSPTRRSICTSSLKCGLPRTAPGRDERQILEQLHAPVRRVDVRSELCARVNCCCATRSAGTAAAAKTKRSAGAIVSFVGGIG